MLLGTFARHPAYAVIATAGIILAALYILLTRTSGSAPGRRAGWRPAGSRDLAGREVWVASPR